MEISINKLKTKNLKLKTKYGQALIEVLFAIGIIGVCLVALAGLMVNSVAKSKYSSNSALANQYAQEGLEIARKTRDSMAWPDFIDGYKSNMGLAKGASIPLGGCPAAANIDSIFIRCINFAVDLPDSLKVTATVSVSWNEGGNTHNTQAVTILSRWSK